MIPRSHEAWLARYNHAHRERVGSGNLTTFAIADRPGDQIQAISQQNAHEYLQRINRSELSGWRF